MSPGKEAPSVAAWGEEEKEEDEIAHGSSPSSLLLGSDTVKAGLDTTSVLVRMHNQQPVTHTQTVLLSLTPPRLTLNILLLLL